MKRSIHPESSSISAICSCGNVFEVLSTCKKDLRIDVCNRCHPFFTGKHRIVDTGGRVDRFRKQFGALDNV